MAFGDYKVGDRGEGVSDLQGYLREVGYNVDVDGVYGTQTRAAVIAFQKARGIRVDGITGPETLVELSKARAEGWRASVAPTTARQPTSQPTTMTAQDPTSTPTESSPMTGLFILLAIAAGVWFFTQRSSSRSTAGYTGPQEGDDEEEEEESEEGDE